MAQELAVGGIIKIIQAGGVGVLPTDTLYGLSGLARRAGVAERIHRLKNTPLDKPLIILIGSLSDLAEFGVELTPQLKEILAKVWPGPVSVVLPGGLAFRLPRKSEATVELHQILKVTGPLFSTSANPTGETPATTITEAKKYFGDRVDFYLDAGPRRSEPSTLISLANGKVEIIRPNPNLKLELGQCR